MKATNTCPKCKSTDITRIKAFRTASTPNRIMLTKWGTHHAWFDRYVCLSCGFIEHYIDLEGESLQKWIKKQRKEGTLESDFV